MPPGTRPDVSSRMEPLQADEARSKLTEAANTAKKEVGHIEERD